MRNIVVAAEQTVPAPGEPVQSCCINIDSHEAYFVTHDNVVLRQGDPGYRVYFAAQISVHSHA